MKHALFFLALLFGAAAAALAVFCGATGRPGFMAINAALAFFNAGLAYINA